LTCRTTRRRRYGRGISSYEPPSEVAATRAADWNALFNTYGFVRSKARGLATKG
jgi:hypothetical protein